MGLECKSWALKFLRSLIEKNLLSILGKWNLEKFEKFGLNDAILLIEYK